MERRLFTRCYRSIGFFCVCLIGTSWLMACGHDEPDPDADAGVSDVSTSENSCGGTEELEGEPGESCEGGDGTWTCDGTDAVVCSVDGAIELSHANPECDDSTPDCSLSATVGDELSLSVRMTRDGVAQEMALVSFELDPISGGADAQLDATSAATDTDGIATTVLQTGDPNSPESATGSVEMRATAADVSGVEPVVFTVHISAGDGGSYVIDVVHEGASQPDFVEAVLLDPNLSCEEVVDTYLNQGVWPSVSDPSLPLVLPGVSVQPDGSINNIMYPGGEEGDRFTVGVAAHRELGNATVHVAYGCNDEGTPIESGGTVHVDVSLVDHLPYFEERYEASHEFVLSGGLPAPIQEVVDMLSGFAESPMEFIFGCPEDIDDCEQALGLVDLLFVYSDIDPDIVDDIEVLRSTQNDYDTGRDYLNGVLMQHGEQGLVPQWAFDSSIIRNDLMEMLAGFGVQGLISFDEQPQMVVEDGVAMGMFSSDNAHQRWDQFSFQWTQGCSDAVDPDCAPFSFGTDVLSNSVVVGNFDATVHGTAALEIAQHTISLDFGELAMGAIETGALAGIFDASVTSVDEMLDTLLSCTDLADTFGDEESSVHDSVQSVCQQLLTSATDVIAEHLGNADGHFKLATPEGEHCTLHQPAEYQTSWPGQPRPYIAGLGLPENSARCHWEAELDHSGDGQPETEVGGQFNGISSP